ncbi:GDP-mannose 4,6-dehydratase [bacterium]|nr:GDP-mannose 4,6-dehydratase [bacterium]
MNTLLITGGAGFIGSNSARYFKDKGWNVVVFDNLSRKGSKDNLKWLQDNYDIKFVKGDIRKYSDLEKAFKPNPITHILHLAAQTTVTLSVTDPRNDFEINAQGTFNVLEAMRNFAKDAKLIYASTNKVYGGMEDVEEFETNGRYEYKNLPLGIPENRFLDFHSPYGCSKGAGDQYVRDYSRIYGLKTVVFRQSCIYGYRQFGVEDQGWVAWFTIATMHNKAITIYGDGKQTRDVLFIDDLVRAYEMAFESNSTNGQIYNVGGGSQNQMSLLELISFLEGFFNKKIRYNFGEWRPGDQKVFVCDITKAHQSFGWKPEIGVKEGVGKLFEWIKANKKLFKDLV